MSVAFSLVLMDRQQRQSVHVSGCSKGCALPGKAAFTVIGRDGKFDLVRDGCSWDQPEFFSLSKTQVLKLASETNDAL